MNILVVDDSRASRALMESFLLESGYHVSLAADGVEAWQKLLNEMIHVVISDWVMPNLSGPDLCRRIRAATFDHYIYIILLTALDQPQNLISGMEAGADDFLLKPLNRNLMRVRLRAAERVIQLEAALAEKNRRVTDANTQLVSAYESLRRNLESAALLQRSLLPAPHSALHGVDLAWLFAPSSFVGGDTLNYFAFDERYLGLYLLDVAGHGVAAALLSVSLNKVLTPQVLTGIPIITSESRMAKLSGPHIMPPSAVAHQLNERFRVDHDDTMFFTLCYGIIDTVKRELELVLAGHPPPLRLRRGQVESLTVEGGLPIGMFPKANYPTAVIPLEKGDRLFFYSDGVIECTNPEGEMFTVDRLCRYLEVRARLPLRVLLAELEATLKAWRGGVAFADDVSLLAMQVN